ncbi:hypothetical protein ACTFIZ_005683 [Dictyostelium cf. discoideum]
MSNKFSLLVIGETGCGKSTLINTITNYFLKGEIPDKIKVSISTKFINSNQNVKSSENDSKDRTKSQTDCCNEYSFKKDSKEFVFIDTPGLSDTRGIKQDDINIGKIIDAAENCSSLSALLIVINGTVPRMTINLQNVITRLRGSIPDSLLNNVFIVFTNCLSHTRNFEINSIEINVNTEYIFHMNNTAFSTDPKSWDETSVESLQTEFKLSFQTLDRILECVTKMSAVSTKDFGEMKAHRHNIKAILHKAKTDIGNLQKLQDSLSQYQHQLEMANKDKESFKNFTTKNTIEKFELKDAPYHSTICSTCDHVCHDNCGLQELSTKGDNAFINCTAMSGSNNCRFCPAKCSYNVHYHGRKTMVKVNKTVEELKDLKEKFLKSSQLSSEFSGKILNLDSAKKLANATLNKMTDDIVKSCKELKKICSGFNLVDELQITLNQMEMEAKNSTSFDARKSADEMIRTIREICDKLNQEEALKTKKKNITIDESKIKNDNAKKHFVDSAEKKQDSNQTKNSNQQQTNSKGDNLKTLKCPSCKNNFDMNKDKFAELMKLGQPIKCKSCHTSNNSNSNETENDKLVKLNCLSCKNDFEISTDTIMKLNKNGQTIVCKSCKFNKQNDPNSNSDKKLNCPTCKNDFQINKDKFKELAKTGQTIICKSCKSNKQNDPKSNDKKLNCPTCKKDFQINKDKFKELANTGQTIVCKSCKSNKQNAPKSNDKKLNCPTCKKDFQINKDKFKELAKNGQIVICKSCKSKKQNAPKTNDKKLNCPTCKKDFQINKDKYKELANNGQTILCKSCKTC